ncbi:hypothetical protein [Actinoplanes sp. NBRC 103695]|uniref:TolB family protein n=1 Tax=Actinoplanes sp. NBRC 103695 TaxID=3032202 RepID=UPI0024A16294|nr:hypothetical protein [Actinoplanes sp. NBRC 103695]GLY93022.1 hypothetical protein Acsp02_02780 [Actinoplanes sp. NBRC 103695]
MSISWGALALVATLHLAPAAAPAAAGAITLVDVAADGTPGDGDNLDWDISDNGRYVTFVSASANLVAGDTNGAYDVFVRDLDAGTTTLVSGGPNGRPADGPAQDTVISGNGRYVAFTSSASNLVAGDTNGRRDVFVHDRRTGVTSRASVGTGNVQFDGIQIGPSLSDNGRYVTFVKSDFQHGNGQEVYLRDLTTGVTRQVSVPNGDGAPAAFEAAISGDGRWATFSGTGDYAGDGGSASAVYLTDLTSGATTRVSPQSSGTAPVDASGPTIDRTGAKVLYAVNAAMTNLHLYDAATGATTLVSANRAGTGAGNADTFAGALSADGRFAAFGSSASDLVRNDPNGNVSDVFVRNLSSERTILVAGGNGSSGRGVPSGNGSRVLFSSEATDLGADPGDGRPHLFVSTR